MYLKIIFLFFLAQIYIIFNPGRKQAAHADIELY